MNFQARQISPDNFAPFGDLVEQAGTPVVINEGLCRRFSDLARLDFDGGRAGISVFQSELRSLPYKLTMMERHPLGSQAFLPLSGDPFLVTVAPDAGGRPGQPQAFLTAPHQGVNIHRNVWHGVLTPLSGPGLFAVVDRIADAGDTRSNLEEHWFDTPYLINN